MSTASFLYAKWRNYFDVIAQILQAGRGLYRPRMDDRWHDFRCRFFLASRSTYLDTAGVADYRSVIGYFAQSMMKDLRLVSGYDVLYGK